MASTPKKVTRILPIGFTGDQLMQEKGIESPKKNWAGRKKKGRVVKVKMEKMF